MLGGFSMRVIELGKRLTEVTGSRVEARFVQIFLKLLERLGRPRESGFFIPLALSRQDLADLAGTTIETSIRIMSRSLDSQRLVCADDPRCGTAATLAAPRGSVT